MAQPWGTAILGAVSPQVAPGSGHIDTGSLMNLGQLLAEKKQQDRYFKQGQEQYTESHRKEALDALHAALSNPDDKLALQEALAEAERWGITVSGLDSLLAPQQAPEEPGKDAESPTEDAAEPGEESSTSYKGAMDEASKLKKKVTWAENQGNDRWAAKGSNDETGGGAGSPPGQSNAPAWLDEYMSSQGVETPQQEATRKQTESDIAASEEPGMPDINVRPSPERAPLPTADGSPNPPPVKPRPGVDLNIPGQLPNSNKGDVVISVDGKPYSRFSAEELHNYRANQAAAVAHVFQPLLDNAVDDTEKRAAQIAQTQAVEAYNSGMTKQQAIEFGNRAWQQLIGMRFKRDYTKYPPGWKPLIPGGGGAAMSDKQALALWDKIDGNDKAWITEARQQFATEYANKSGAEAGMILAAANSQTPIAQNQGLVRILHEISGTAVTNTEAARFFEGTDIPTKIEMVLRGITGGEQPEKLKQAVEEIGQAMRARSQELTNKAGQFVYERILTDPNIPESDQQREYHARTLRALFTGESITPMKKGKKKGTLEKVATPEADAAKADALMQ